MAHDEPKTPKDLQKHASLFMMRTSLKVLDPERPIREADIKRGRRRATNRLMC